MITMTTSDVSTRLLDDAVARAAERAQLESRPVLLSYSVEASAPLDPVAIFAAGAFRPGYRAYWEQPATGELLVGLGEADAASLRGDARFADAAGMVREGRERTLTERPAGLPGGPVRFAAFAFAAERDLAGAWREVPDGRLILPRLLVASSAGRTSHTINLWVDPYADLEALAIEARADLDRLSLLSLDSAGESAAPEIVARVERPDAVTWRQAVADSVASIRLRELEKVVLARSLELAASAPFSPESALRRLRAGGPAATVFAIANGPRCFLGATPERLVRLRDGIVSVDCLAGSIARGVDDAADAQLADQLLASAKDRGEHDVVVRSVEQALAGVCDQISRPVDAPHIRQSRNVQHLSTPLTGRLRAGACVINLVERLHPTPAVGGFPRELALDMIRAREGFDRGWYAGPVGWVDEQGEGEFAVALRSGLLNGNNATLFGGAGIVADSEPDAEYAETGLKMRPMLAALGVEV